MELVFLYRYGQYSLVQNDDINTRFISKEQGEEDEDFAQRGIRYARDNGHTIKKSRFFSETYPDTYDDWVLTPSYIERMSGQSFLSQMAYYVDQKELVLNANNEDDYWLLHVEKDGGKDTRRDLLRFTNEKEAHGALMTLLRQSRLRHLL